MSIYDDIRPLSLDDVHTYPLDERASKVSVADFAHPIEEDATLRSFLERARRWSGSGGSHLAMA